MRQTLLRAAAVVLIVGVPAPTSGFGLPLEGEAAEEFLKTAKIARMKEFDGRAITHPQVAELTDGERTLRASFKTVDIRRPTVELENKEVYIDFRDHWTHEVAAYHLDRLLGLGIVPPCVKRRVGPAHGAMCLWVENAITEWDRERADMDPPDLESWNRQVHTIRLFLQLTFDIDCLNARNLLIDENWKIYKIDSSRAFRLDHELRGPDELDRFSRSVLSALRALDPVQVQLRLDPYLDKGQINAIMARRDLILELAEQRVEEHGEAAVLFP
jgi:hypothetical protein